MFLELPRYIDYIIGYSPSKSRMYFKGRGDRGLLSTFDGKTVELAAMSELPGDIEAAINVPGHSSADVTDVTWGTTLFKGI